MHRYLLLATCVLCGCEQASSDISFTSGGRQDPAVARAILAEAKQRASTSAVIHYERWVEGPNRRPQLTHEGPHLRARALPLLQLQAIEVALAQPTPVHEVRSRGSRRSLFVEVGPVLFHAFLSDAEPTFIFLHHERATDDGAPDVEQLIRPADTDLSETDARVQQFSEYPP